MNYAEKYNAVVKIKLQTKIAKNEQRDLLFCPSLKKKYKKYKNIESALELATNQ